MASWSCCSGLSRWSRASCCTGLSRCSPVSSATVSVRSPLSSSRPELSLNPQLRPQATPPVSRLASHAVVVVVCGGKVVGRRNSLPTGSERSRVRLSPSPSRRPTTDSQPANSLATLDSDWTQPDTLDNQNSLDSQSVTLVNSEGSRFSSAN